MKKYFYGKNEILSWPLNVTYGELVTYDDKTFYDWCEELRVKILQGWDENDMPPLIGRNESEIVQSFSKLRQFDSTQIYHKPQTGNDSDVIGVIANFSKNGSTEK